MKKFDLEVWQAEQAKLMLEDLREILYQEVEECLAPYQLNAFGYEILNTYQELLGIFKEPYELESVTPIQNDFKIYTYNTRIYYPKLHSVIKNSDNVFYYAPNSISNPSSLWVDVKNFFGF